MYGELQGLHSGIDLLTPINTPITNAINRPGEIIAIDGEPYNYKAGPGSILVDYGEFLILYGHTSHTDREVGDIVNPGEVVGYSGTDGKLPHLHLEVIKKDPAWDSLPADKKSKVRPGSIRTNPVPYLSPEIRQQLKAKVWDSFHPTSDDRWQTPEDQPDIHPGKKHLIK